MFYTYNDISLYYKKYGEHKKSIVILPGWGDTRATFDSLISALSLNYTVSWIWKNKISSSLNDHF